MLSQRKDYHGEVAKFAELRWFHRIAKQSKLAEQWKDPHWVGKLKRADEHLLVMRSGIWAVSYSGIENEYGNRHTSCQTEVRHESSVERTQAYTTLHTRCAWDTGAHCRARFEIIWTKEFAEAEVVNSTVDAVPFDPNVRVSEPVEPAAAAGGQPTAMEANTDGQRDVRGNTTHGRAGGAAPQPVVSQARPMDVSLDQRP